MVDHFVKSWLMKSRGLTIDALTEAQEGLLVQWDSYDVLRGNWKFCSFIDSESRFSIMKTNGPKLKMDCPHPSTR